MQALEINTVMLGMRIGEKPLDLFISALLSVLSERSVINVLSLGKGIFFSGDKLKAQLSDAKNKLT